MNPDDLARLTAVSDPQLHPDGARVAFVVTRMDLTENRYVQRIHLWDGERARPFTAGPGDTRPRWAPDGSHLALLRTSGDQGAMAQVAVMPTDGGEARLVTSFDLGAGEAEWSPDGSRLAVIGRLWRDEWAGLDDEERVRRPRRITGAGYRFDDRGWLFDRRAAAFVVDAAGGDPVAVGGPGDWFDSGIGWDPGGSSVVFSSARHPERYLDSGTQVWRAPADGSSAPVALVDPGMWHTASPAPDGSVLAVGIPDPWSYPDVIGLYRLADGEPERIAGHVDRSFDSPSPTPVPAGPAVLTDGSLLSVLEDRGRLTVVRVEPGGEVTDVAGGDRMVTGFAARPDGSAFAFTATTPTDPGALWWWEGGEERRLTDYNAEIGASLVEPVPFTVERDGAEIDAWAYLPPGDGPVPLLLNIHGGPATQYGWGFFDEFQVYAGAGYGVIACNPGGSSGRGRDFMRVPVGRWGEERPPDLEDLLAVVDGALARFDRLDSARMGVMGGSYGGFMTARILAVDDRWASGIAERGLYDFTSFAGTSDIGHRFPRMYLGDWSHDDWSPLWAASPLSRAHRIETPCLILHSEQDWRCPVEQAEQLHAVLVSRGVATEMVRFPGGSHELSRSGAPRSRHERFLAILDWNGRRLAPFAPDVET